MSHESCARKASRPLTRSGPGAAHAQRVGPCQTESGTLPGGPACPHLRDSGLADLLLNAFFSSAQPRVPAAVAAASPACACAAVRASGVLASSAPTLATPTCLPRACPPSGRPPWAAPGTCPPTGRGTPNGVPEWGNISLPRLLAPAALADLECRPLEACACSRGIIGWEGESPRATSCPKATPLTALQAQHTGVHAHGGRCKRALSIINGSRCVCVCVCVCVCARASSCTNTTPLAALKAQHTGVHAHWESCMQLSFWEQVCMQGLLPAQTPRPLRPCMRSTQVCTHTGIHARSSVSGTSYACNGRVLPELHAPPRLCRLSITAFVCAKPS